jgi:hypothetical protein
MSRMKSAMAGFIYREPRAFGRGQMKVFRLRVFGLEHPLLLGGTENARDHDGPSVVGASRKISGAGRVKKRRLSWDPSASPDLAGYRIYWACGEDIGYDSDFLEVGNVTSIILPDDIPWSRENRGRVAMGVTAVSSGGNESDMSVVSFFCDFGIPEGPTNLTLEDISEAVQFRQPSSFQRNESTSVG